MLVYNWPKVYIHLFDHCQSQTGEHLTSADRTTYNVIRHIWCQWWKMYRNRSGHSNFCRSEKFKWDWFSRPSSHSASGLILTVLAKTSQLVLETVCYRSLWPMIFIILTFSFPRINPFGYSFLALWGLSLLNYMNINEMVDKYARYIHITMWVPDSGRWI